MLAAKDTGYPLGTNSNRAATVLVVEDNELNMRLFHDLLEAHGYRVLRATDGETGFKLARDEQPNVIIMDVQLPGASGLETTQRIKADPATREIPVAAVTALAMPSDEQRTLAAGCDAYVAKPISCTELLAVVARFLT